MSDPEKDAKEATLFDFTLMCGEAAKHVDPRALIVMFAIGPRQFAKDHIVCVACGSDSTLCPALLFAERVVAFADDAGHPEWVDGEGIEEA